MHCELLSNFPHHHNSGNSVLWTSIWCSAFDFYNGTLVTSIKMSSRGHFLVQLALNGIEDQSGTPNIVEESTLNSKEYEKREDSSFNNTSLPNLTYITNLTNASLTNLTDLSSITGVNDSDIPSVLRWTSDENVTEEEAQDIFIKSIIRSLEDSPAAKEQNITSSDQTNNEFNNFKSPPSPSRLNTRTNVKSYELLSGSSFESEIDDINKDKDFDIRQYPEESTENSSDCSEVCHGNDIESPNIVAPNTVITTRLSEVLKVIEIRLLKIPMQKLKTNHC